MDHYEHLAKCKLKVLEEIPGGMKLEKGAKILDFGCGKGDLAKAFLDMGYDAYGVDFMDSSNLDSDHYRKIELNPYRIPFEDNYFDYVYSTSVFEHVQNTDESLREVYRVLKPGGITMHSMPSRYRIIEPHEKIPFGGMIHTDFWIKLWVFLGVRNRFQKGLPYKEVFRRDKGYFRDCLNYMSYRKLRKKIIAVFGNVTIPNREYIKHMPGGAAKLGRMFPIPGYKYVMFFFREWNFYMKK